MPERQRRCIETKRTPCLDAPWVSIRPAAYSTGSRLAGYEMALPLTATCAPSGRRHPAIHRQAC